MMSAILNFLSPTLILIGLVLNTIGGCIMSKTANVYLQPPDPPKNRFSGYSSNPSPILSESAKTKMAIEELNRIRMSESSDVSIDYIMKSKTIDDKNKTIAEGQRKGLNYLKIGFVFQTIGIILAIILAAISIKYVQI